MSLAYTLRESISGFTRTKLSTTISIITISISLLFLGIFAVISTQTSRFIDVLRDQVELEAFLDEPITPKDLSTVQERIKSLAGVQELTYVSKDDAAKLFQKEFGENILNVLEFNPLPASLKVSLKDGYKTSARVAEVSKAIEGIHGIESVKYRKELLEVIDTRAATLHNLTLGLGVLISLSAILLVSNTIRLAIYAKRQLIRTMELVGATRVFIRVPFLLEGMIQGIVGGILASALLYVLLEYSIRLVSIELAGSLHREPLFYAGVLATGLLLGLIGGIISVMRFIRTSS